MKRRGVIGIGSGGVRRSLRTGLEAMAGAWCATCCPPSVLPALFPVATCNRSLKFSAHSNSGLVRRQFSRGSVAVCRRTEVQCCCSCSSSSEPYCSNSDSHFTSRRQLLLLVSGAAATAAALPSSADEVLSPMRSIAQHFIYSCPFPLIRALI